MIDNDYKAFHSEIRMNAYEGISPKKYYKAKQNFIKFTKLTNEGK